MGLDMYLSASKYVGGWNHSKESEKEQFKAVLAALGMSPEAASEGSPSLTVQVKAVYWRKANAIHRWFVETVQDGVDECDENYVSREQLEALVALCKDAVANKDNEKLPPQSGFFFGSTDIDEGYWSDLQDTITNVEKAMQIFNDDWSFYYRSSW